MRNVSCCVNRSIDVHIGCTSRMVLHEPKIGTMSLMQLSIKNLILQ